MEISISMFGRTITFKMSVDVSNSGAVEKVKSIIKKELGQSVYTFGSKKIDMIKILRRPEVGGILVRAGLVPENDMRDDGISVGLAFAKEWVEINLPEFC